MYTEKSVTDQSIDATETNKMTMIFKDKKTLKSYFEHIQRNSVNSVIFLFVHMITQYLRIQQLKCFLTVVELFDLHSFLSRQQDLIQFYSR